jgi:hypothetical protein
MLIAVELLYGTLEREKGKENDRAIVISHTTKCESRGYKDVY